MPMTTIVTPQLPSYDEYGIVALLSDVSAQLAAGIQTELVKHLGDVIWLQQPPSLHITLMEIICDIDYRDLSRREQFEKWYDQYGQRTKEIIAEFASIEVAFNELYVSQRAIILKAADPQPFNNIRARLLSEIALPEGTKQPPDIIHTSLARFTRIVDLEWVRMSIQDITVDFVEHVNEFSLVKELGPPKFNGTPLEGYVLSGDPMAGSLKAYAIDDSKQAIREAYSHKYSGRRT